MNLTFEGDDSLLRLLTIVALWQHVMSIRFTSLEGVSLRFHFFNDLIVSFAPTLPVDLPILVSDLLVNVLWEALVSVVPVL